MSKSDEMQDLVAFFYAEGRRAALLMEANKNQVPLQRSPSVPSVDISGLSKNTIPPKIVATDGTNHVLRVQKEEPIAKDSNYKVASCALPKTSQTLPAEPVCKSQSHDPKVKVLNRHTSNFGSPKSIVANLPSKPVSPTLNVKSKAQILVSSLHQSASSIPSRTFVPLPIKPVSELLKKATIGIDESETIAKIWSNLSNYLAMFVGSSQSADGATEIEKALIFRLSEALKVMSSTKVQCQSVNIPFDDLIRVSDVFGCIGSSVWDRSKEALEIATSILEGKTLMAVCSTTTQLKKPFWANQKPSSHEEQIISVQFRNCRNNGMVEDMEDTLVATGAYVRVEEPEIQMVKGRQESVTFIKMQDACHFWAYVGPGWQQQFKELDAIYEECDISGDELWGEDGGELYLTMQPKKGDILLMAAEDCVPNDFDVSAIRVRVINVDRNKVHLWCLDLAVHCVQEWRVLRRCPKKMLRLPYLAELCRITGLAAFPSIEIVKKCSSLLMVLLSRWTFTLKETTLSNFFTVFLSLSCGLIEALQRPALLCVCIGTTLADNEKQSHLKFNNFISKYLDMIRNVSSCENICEGVEEELRILTQTIRNIMFNYAELRKHFAQLGGFPVIMQLVMSRKLNDVLEMEMWKLMRVLFGAGDLCKETVTSNPKVVQKLPTEALSVNLPPKRPIPILPRKSIKYLLAERKLASLAEKKAETNNHTKEMSPLHINSATSPCIRQYLIRGKVFHQQPNDTTLMQRQRKVNEIVNLNVIQAVCGLLNSDTGGTIYFGIGPGNLVEGINVARKQRDEIRIGFDNFCDKQLIPRIRPNACNLTYIKVFEPSEPKDLDRAQHTLHIIKVEIKGSSSMLYKMKSGQYFLIKDGESKVATIQELREKVIRSTEQKFI